MKIYGADFRNIPYAFTTNKAFYKEFKRDRKSNELHYWKGEIDNELDLSIMSHRMRLITLEEIPLKSRGDRDMIIGTAFENYVLSAAVDEAHQIIKIIPDNIVSLVSEEYASVLDALSLYPTIDELNLFVDLFSGIFMTDPNWKIPLNNGEPYVKGVLV